MDIAKIIQSLRRQREDIDQAILSMERLSGAGPRRRGRPRKYPADDSKLGQLTTIPTVWLRPQAAASSPARLDVAVDERMKRAMTAGM
jgi:hypothetical protein